MKKKMLSILLVLLFIAAVPVFAEGEQENTDQIINNVTTPSTETVVDDAGTVTETIPDGKTKLDLAFVSDFAGYTIEIKDSEGQELGNVSLDARGSGSVVIDQAKNISIKMSSSGPTALKTNKNTTTWSLADIIFISLIASVIVGFICYQIAKKKTIKRFEPALDVIFNKELDD